MGLAGIGLDLGRASKLSDVLFCKRKLSYSSLAHLPSNVGGVEASLLFSARLRNFVVLHGPSGWGKTHLLEAAASRLSHENGVSVDVLSATDFAIGAHRPDPALPLVLDDLQDVLNKPKMRLALRVALERRVRSGRATMIAGTDTDGIRVIRSAVPFPRTWKFAKIGDPTSSERLSVITQLCESEDITLHPDLILIMAERMFGNGRTLEGALKRLKLDSLAWTERSSLLRALGLLDPYFADNPDWDLRIIILRAVESLHARQFNIDPLDLALFVMLRTACLSEEGTAQALQLDPGTVYLKALGIEKRFREGELNPAVVDKICDFVLHKITKDPA